MPHLFDTLTLKSVTLRNRIGVSPMCEYSSIDGFATDWHLVHLGSRAVGGAGLVIMEATAVEARGRITPDDNGIWKDEHLEMLSRITRFIKSQGAVPGIQIAHAGRKASRHRPWDAEGDVPNSAGGWDVIAPSPVAFADGYRTPVELAIDEIPEVTRSFGEAARRARDAGFEFLEIHSAHGYLLHEFLSPLSNRRKDKYGGDFENRTRFPLEVVRACRQIWPDNLPLALRLSCSDWVAGGWSIEESIELSKKLKQEGIDLVDCSSGGNVADAKIFVGANYQVPFAEAIKKGAAIPTAAVGMITESMQADAIVRNHQADIVLLARELLRDPYWPLKAAKHVHQAKKAPIPPQYLRAFTDYL